MTYRLISLIVLGVVGLLVAGIIALQLSLWFLWELLPTGDVHLAISHTPPGHHLIAELTTPVHHLDPHLITATRHLAVSRQENTTTLIATPRRLTNRSALVNYLTTQGWHVKRYGLLVTAASTAPPQLNTTGLLGRTIDRLRSSQLPLRPAIIAHANPHTILPLDQPLYAIGRANRHPASPRTFTIAISTEHLPPVGQDHQTLAELLNEKSLSITLQSQFIQAMPDRAQQLLRQTITDNLHLTGAHLDLATALNARHTLRLTTHPEHATLTVKGDALAFVDHAKSWAQAAEAVARQEIHAFRLPDNTVGFEYTAGQPQLIFNQPPDQACQSATWTPSATPPAPITLWLCTHDDQASLSTNHDQALAAARQPIATSTPWAARAATTHLTDIHPALQTLHASGTATQATITVVVDP